MPFEAVAILPPVAVCKTVTIILGLVIVVLGLYSHFESDWVMEVSRSNGTVIFEKLYYYCRQPIKIKCPDISMEHYFICVTAITFIISFSAMIGLSLANEYPDCWRQMDMVYHVVGSLTLLAGGIAYIVSAEQIDNMHIIFESDDDDTMKPRLPNFKKLEKIGAGALTVFQAVLFGTTAYFINKQGNDMERFY